MDGLTNLIETQQIINWLRDKAARADNPSWTRMMHKAADRLQELEQKQRWIPVTERLPEPEIEVMVLAERKCYSFRTKSVTTHHIVTTGMYEDGSKNTEDSGWVWETDGFEYDEELDAYIIPEGWWEYKHYNGDYENNYAIDDFVTHWMSLPEPPKEGE